VECLAACAGAPACLVEKKYLENVTAESIDKVLDKLAGK